MGVGIKMGVVTLPSLLSPGNSKLNFSSNFEQIRTYFRWIAQEEKQLIWW